MSYKENVRNKISQLNAIVDIVSSMVTCRMMIRLVLYDLQNNKHCVGGADDPPPMLK
jgi:hypothetical protein